MHTAPQHVCVSWRQILQAHAQVAHCFKAIDERQEQRAASYFDYPLHFTRDQPFPGLEPIDEQPTAAVVLHGIGNSHGHVTGSLHTGRGRAASNSVREGERRMPGRHGSACWSCTEGTASHTYLLNETQHRHNLFSSHSQREILCCVERTALHIAYTSLAFTLACKCALGSITGWQARPI